MKGSLVFIGEGVGFSEKISTGLIGWGCTKSIFL